ncbi:unnamed protein product [Moneuplotes crassus]|uniref:BZIP domain-containing protein n=1 Tax=Euplotes crassus TaxID=5936 RepID=A0AAD2CZ42_EUPCR|nr:unnamed protein product [Moneuplotes crassus]
MDKMESKSSNTTDPTISIKSKKIKDTKQRSQEYRKRKKEFVESLRTEVKSLHLEIEQLKIENKRLQEKLKLAEENGKSQDPVVPPLKRNEQYCEDHLWVDIKKDPSSIRYSMIDKVAQDMRDASEDRINFIKEQFNNILSNMLSLPTRCNVSIFKSMSVKEYDMYCSNKKRKKKYFSKKIESAKDIFTQYTFSEPLSKYMIYYSSFAVKIFGRFESVAQELVLQRNKLFNLINEMQDLIDSNTELPVSYEKEDIAKIADMCAKIKEHKLISPHVLWDIPKKIHENKKYEGGELTDQEE